MGLIHVKEEYVYRSNKKVNREAKVLNQSPAHLIGYPISAII